MSIRENQQLIEQKISNLQTKMQNNLSAMGVTSVKGKTLHQLADNVLDIPVDDRWTRPADRPSVPDVKDNEMYMLFGVKEGMPNDVAFLISTSSSSTNYIVDWGDGTTDAVTRNVQAEHIYDFDSIEAPVNGQGFKWVWISVKLTGTGYMTTYSMTRRHSQRPVSASTAIIAPQIFEIYMQAPNLTTNSWSTSSYVRYAFLEIFDFRGTNKMTTLAYFLRYSYNLRVCNIDTTNITSFSSTFLDCISLRGINNGGDGSGEFDVSGATTLSSFLSGCYNWEQKITGDTSKVTSFSSAFYSWRKYNHQIDLDTSNAITFGTCFNTLSSYTGTITLDLSSATTALTTSTFGGSNFNCRGLRLLNMSTLHNVVTATSTSMDENALALLIGDLCDRTGLEAGTCDLRGNFGTPRLSEEAIALAASKNWTLTL